MDSETDVNVSSDAQLKNQKRIAALCFLVGSAYVLFAVGYYISNPIIAPVRFPRGLSPGVRSRILDQTRPHDSLTHITLETGIHEGKVRIGGQHQLQQRSRGFFNLSGPSSDSLYDCKDLAATQAVLAGAPVSGQCVDPAEQPDFFCSVAFPGGKQLPRSCVWKPTKFDNGSAFPYPHPPFPNLENTSLENMLHGKDGPGEENLKDRKCSDSFKIYFCATITPACDEHGMVNATVTDYGFFFAHPCKCLCEKAWENCNFSAADVNLQCSAFPDANCQGAEFC